MKRAAIFFQKYTPFNRNLISGMKKGLEAHGIEVFYGLEYPDESSMIGFCRDFRPDVIFEMNRTRQDVPYLPKEIKHIAWIVDTNGREKSPCSGSDIIYFIGANWLRANPSGSALTDWLPPGVCEESYYYENSPKVSDLSFIGHMPLPWSSDEKERLIVNGANRHFTFGDLLGPYMEKLGKMDLSNFANDHYIEAAMDIVRAQYDNRIEPGLDVVLRYDIGCRAVRLYNRKNLIDLVLKSFDDVRLFGPENWLQWPEYCGYYNGFLYEASEMRKVYQDSRINLHEGIGVHFRSMDCLASGGLLFYRRGPDDNEYGGINSLFEPDRHFVSFSDEDFHEKASHYLADEKQCLKVAENGAKEAVEKHTWYHRWNKIIDDLGKL